MYVVKFKKASIQYSAKIYNTTKIFFWFVKDITLRITNIFKQNKNICVFTNIKYI